MVAERAARRRVQVEHQREDRLAGNVKKLDLPAAQVLAGSERVDLASSGGSQGGGGVVVRVLDVDFSSWLAGEDVRLAAAQPDVSSGTGGFGGDFVILETKRILALEPLDLLTLKKKKQTKNVLKYRLLVTKTQI